MSTTVKTFQSSQAILPALSGQAGALKTILKTCLVDGAGAQTVTINVASGVASVTFPTAHGMLADGILLVAGATPAALNGEQRISAVVNNMTLTYPTTAADGAATGTITAKLASAGWQELFTGTNLTALKPTAIEATGCVLRVDDTGTKTARWRGYESMSDINTGLGPFPTEAQLSGGCYVMKSMTADATARAWRLIADDRGFLLAVEVRSAGYWTLYWAGDVSSLRSGDPYCFMVTGDTADRTGTGLPPEGCCGYSGRTARAGAYTARASTGLGDSVQMQRVGEGQNGTGADAWSGAATYAMTGDGANLANHGLLLSRLELIASGLRGTVPGVWHARNNVTSLFSDGISINGTHDLAGRKLLAIRTGVPAGNTWGITFVDLTGPWERP